MQLFHDFLPVQPPSSAQPSECSGASGACRPWRDRGGGPPSAASRRRRARPRRWLALHAQDWSTPSRFAAQRPRNPACPAATAGSAGEAAACGGSAPLPCARPGSWNRRAWDLGGGAQVHHMPRYTPNGRIIQILKGNLFTASLHPVRNWTVHTLWGCVCWNLVHHALAEANTRVT